MRLVTEGFESGDNLGFDYINTDFVITTEHPRSGHYCTAPGSTSTSSFAIPVRTELYIRFGVYLASTNINNNRQTCSWRFGTASLGSLRITNGKFTGHVGSGLQLIPNHPQLEANRWYLVEVHVKIDSTNGMIELKLDGNLCGTYIGNTTIPGQTTINNIGFDRDQLYFDDIAINDTFGDTDNSWCGDGHVVAMVPDGPGDVTQLSPSSGANWSCVDEIPSNNDTDYVEGSVPDTYDLYSLTSPNISNVTINRVWVEARARDTEPLGGKIALGLKTHDVESWSGDIPVYTQYAVCKGTEYQVNPQTGLPWTISELNDLQAGWKVRE